MIGGHYATALVPYTRLDRKAPLWLLLTAAIILDFLLLGFVAIGLETAVPHGDTPPDMRFSHDLIPVIGIAVAVIFVTFFITRNRAVAVWATVLVLFHEMADLASGFQHNVFGPDTKALGLNNYMTNPLQAIAIEALLVLACLAYYRRSERIANRNFAQWKLPVLFVVLVMPTVLILAPQLFG